MWTSFSTMVPRVSSLSSWQDFARTGLSPDNPNAFTGALGTAVAGGPPHRSVREELPVGHERLTFGAPPQNRGERGHPLLWGARIAAGTLPGH